MDFTRRGDAMFQLVLHSDESTFY